MREALERPYDQFFGTLANQTRLEIIEALKKEPMTIGEISTHTNREQSAISHNIHRLVKCGFVTIEPRGREKICTLNKTTIKPLVKLMDHHINRYCRRVKEMK